jgi:uncharacterized protein (TIGR00251 family)
MANLAIQKVDDGVVFGAKLVPSSSRTAICGLLDGVLKIKVSAPPEKGKANRSLLEFLAEQLGVKKNAVTIISGKTNQIKRIQILGISAERVLRRLGLSERGPH